jgi:HEAT repeat protein
LLLDALRDPVAAVRLYAARSLSGIGSLDAAAIPTLIESLGDGEWEVRDLAAMLLARFESEAIPALLAALAAPAAGRDEEFHLMAIWTLGSIGPAAQGAVPALAGLLDDPRAGTRCQAAIALGKIGPPAAGAAPALERRLEDEDAEVRRFAADALKKILDP